MSSHSKFFTLPDNLWFITYESIKVTTDDCHDGQFIDTVPVSQDEYGRIKDNPFRGISTKRALRLDLYDGIIEIVSLYEDYKYYVRYLMKPSPIILVDLPNDLTIEGTGIHTECNLH